MIHSLKYKILFSSLASITNLVAPIIVLPYVTKTVGFEGYGLFSYYESITQYIILFVSLGSTLYGAREIGYCRGNKEREKQVFIDIIILRLICLCIVGFVILILKLCGEVFTDLFWVLLINVVSASIDVTFYYQGIGEFKKLALRSGLIKGISIALIFLLVKHSDDVILYAYIVVLASFFLNIFFLIDSRKFFLNIKYIFSFLSFKYLCIGIFRLFLLQISISIYSYFGKIMVGHYSTLTNLGYFDIGYKIVFVILTINSAISAVIMPDISNFVENSKENEIGLLATKSLAISWYVLIPIFFIINYGANEISYVLFGVVNVGVVDVVHILSFILFISPLGNVIGVQVLVPLKRELILTLAPLIGLFFNVISNYVLTPKYGHIGASISTVLTEIAGSLFVFFLYGKILNFCMIGNFIHKVLFSSFLAFSAIYLYSLFFEPNLGQLVILKLLIFPIIILFILFLLKDKFLLKSISL